MAAAPALVMAAGAGVTAYAQVEAANAQADAYERQAYAKTLQAGEIIKASEREAELTRQKGEQIRGAQLSAFGRSGVSGSSGTPLLMMQKTLEDARSEEQAVREAGKYRAFNSLYEAAGARQIADETRTGGKLSAFATVLGAGKDYASAKGAL